MAKLERSHSESGAAEGALGQAPVSIAFPSSQGAFSIAVGLRQARGSDRKPQNRSYNRNKHVSTLMVGSELLKRKRR